MVVLLGCKNLFFGVGFLCCLISLFRFGLIWVLLFSLVCGFAFGVCGFMFLCWFSLLFDFTFLLLG